MGLTSNLLDPLSEPVKGEAVLNQPLTYLRSVENPSLSVTFGGSHGARS
jgi:hypothetical protein